MSEATDVDSRVRIAAFDFLAVQMRAHGDELPYRVLLKGFDFEGRRVPLLGPQGIFKPAVLPELPLSISTAPPVPGRDRPYEDELGADGSSTTSIAARTFNIVRTSACAWQGSGEHRSCIFTASQ